MLEGPHAVKQLLKHIFHAQCFFPESNSYKRSIRYAIN